MRFAKYLLPCAIAACSYAASMHAAETFSSVEGRAETDTKALADFVKTKSGISIAEKGGNLMLSGEVKAKWDHLKAKTDGKNLRGKDTGTKDVRAPFATNEMAIEANLVFGYKADRTWAVTQLKLQNYAGTYAYTDEEADKGIASKKHSLFGSAQLSNLILRKAYLGYNIYDGGTSSLNAEIGRRRMYDVFDSKVMFDSYFDSILLSYNNSFESIADLQVKVAPFAIDTRVNHFGWIGEVGFLNMGDVGIDFKYSYTNWHKDGVNCFDHKDPQGGQFGISQYLLAYNFSPDYLRMPTQVYGAYIFNHRAKAHDWTHGSKAREAFYVGFRVGELKKANDWAFDVSYRWVQAQAVPGNDIRDLYRDNPSNTDVYVHNSAGFANFKGYSIDGLYNVTNNLTLEAKFGRVHQCQKKIGGKHRAWGFELDAIYAF